MRKSIKRIVSSTLSAALVLSASAGAFAQVPDDALESKHLEAIKALNALDIMVGDDEGNFRPGDKLTRSEFARIAVSILGMDDVAQAANYPTKFADVPAYHWANGYINVAASQNIIVGDENGNFMPDAEISYVEALAILVRILGYEPMADSRGGWPMGYLLTGNSIGIGEGISASSADKITREQIAQLAFNSLSINLMEQVGYGQNPSYEVVDKTIIEDVLDVEKVTGPITATPITALTGNTAASGEFRVGDTTLESDQNVNHLLGMNVEVYAKDGSAILINEEDTNVKEITTSKIKSITTSGSVVTVTYNTNSNVKFDLGKVVYISNGKKVTLEESNLNDLKNGSVLRAIDYDNDGRVDVLFTTVSRNIVVEKADTKTYRITDKYGNQSVTLNPENATISITKDGQTISFEDLKEWDVLTIVESADKSYYEIRVSNQTVTGTVTETDGSKYTIDGTAYSVASNYKETINVGDEGTFYLDADGNIAGFDENATISSNYAYLVNGVMGKYNASADLVILNKEGNVVELSTESKVRFNGTSTSAADVFAALQEASAIKQQLITYEVNADNKIVEINTATENATPNTEQFLLNAKLDGAAYDKEKGLFGRYGVDENTLVFSIPAGSSDPSDFTVTNGSMFENATEYDIQIFDLDYNYDAGVVIVTSAEYKVDSKAPIAFVNRVTTALTDNGRVDKLYATVNNETVELNAVSSGLLVKDSGTALEKGDMIQYKVNANNEITDINVLFDVDDKATESTTTISEDLTMVYGKVTAATTRTMDLSVNDGEAKNYYTGNAKVYFMDQNNVVTESSASEITPFDAEFPILTLAKVYQGEVVEIVLIEQ